jgi:phosphotransferase system HPr-like phosphotransfer protein
MLDLMSLQCPRGTRLTIRVEDVADAAVLDAIVELIESGFGESSEDE